MKKVASIFCIAVILGIVLPALTFAAVPVKVVNDDSEPMPIFDVDKPSIQYFQQELDFNFDPTKTGGGSSFVVPEGKRLVIEFVSANIYLEQGKAVDFSIAASVNGVIAHHRLLLNELWPVGIYPITYNVSQNMRIYADPLAEVLVYVNNTDGGNGSVYVSISGYLVDLP